MFHCIDQSRIPGFRIWSVKIESEALDQLRLSMEIKFLVGVVYFDACTFLAFLNLTCYLENTGIGVFWLPCAAR